MNIALAGFIIIILLLPGLLFRKSYLSGEFSREYIVEDFFELLVNSLIPSFIFYVIAIPIIYIFGYAYNIQHFLALLSSDKSLINDALINIEDNKSAIFIFNTIINICAYTFGFCAKKIVLKGNLDTKFSTLKFDNIWHYLLTAKFILFKRSQIELTEDSIEDIDITYIFALVNVGNTPIIYNGALVDYELSTDGSLDLLYLKNVKRKVLHLSENNDQTQEDFKDIEGNILILKYQNIINLSISFIVTDIISDATGNIIAIQPRLIK